MAKTDPPNVKRVARDLATARQRLETAMNAAQDTAVTMHRYYGYAETEIARQLGVNRLTVRRWLGKNY
jgi:DNA-directed RNA polymerase specialized sigma24 family protein